LNRDTILWAGPLLPSGTRYSAFWDETADFRDSSALFTPYAEKRWSSATGRQHQSGQRKAAPDRGRGSVFLERVRGASCARSSALDRAARAACCTRLRTRQWEISAI